MVKSFFRATFLMALVITLAACGTVSQKSVQERTAEFTAESLKHTGCPNGVVEGSENLGTGTDSRVEYYRSSRYGEELVIRYQQRGFMDVKCNPPPKKEKATTIDPKAPVQPKAGAKK